MKPLSISSLIFSILLFSTFAMAQPTASKLLLSPEYALEKRGQIPRPMGEGWQIDERAYPDFSALEWQIHLTSTTSSVSMHGKESCSADFLLTFPMPKEVTLRGNKGSHAETSDFEPWAKLLERDVPVLPLSLDGRSSDGMMPYFNLGDGQGGLIVAVGWTGNWGACFTCLEPGNIQVTIGLNRSALILPPNEELSLPSILVMPYAGDWLDGQNKFRRLMLRHFTPANHPPMTLMPVAASVHGMIGFNDTTEENLRHLAKDIGVLDLPLDTFWLDAGWNEGGFPLGQGNPNPDPTRYPEGLAPVGEAVSGTGMRFLTWFEPERVMRGTWLDREHPDWLLLPSNTPPALRYHENDGFRLLDLGKPEARAWAVESVSSTLRDARIAIYRQDFNLYPAYFWQTGRTPEETALCEVRYINGLYTYLDELVARFPGIIIDNCASGGRRLDFEMMRRSVALWRSDSCWGDKDFPRNVQAMAHGLSLWLPLHGLGAASTDTVALRSGMGACASYAINFRDPAAVAALRAHLERYLPVRALYTADYYPLTPWSIDPKEWLAYQFHDPETGRGIVQAFCGDTQGREQLTVKLRGLDEAPQYTLANWDETATISMTGKALMKGGVQLHATRTNEAIVMEYRISDK